MMNEELDPRFGGRSQQSGAYKILFIERLPKKIKAETLIDIFQDHHGFVEVRLIADKGIAFVEFINDDLAT